MTRAEKLFTLLGGVDDCFIEEAASPVSRPQKQIHWKRWAALAACLLLVLAAPHLMPRMGSSEAPMEPGANAAPGDLPPTQGEGDRDYGDGNPMESAAGDSFSSPQTPEDAPGVGGTEIPLPYDLTSNGITIYTPAPDTWLTVQAVDKAAKRLCTILTISEPEPADPSGNIPIAWLDLGNGTAVGLFPDDYAVVYSYTGIFDPDSTETLSPHLQGVFPGLEATLTQVLEHPAETWDTQASNTPEDSILSAPTGNP